MTDDSLFGAEQVPLVTTGRDAATLGPSHSSDSGSDMMGIPEGQDTTPGVMSDPPMLDGADIGADIGVNRVFSAEDGDASNPELSFEDELAPGTADQRSPTLAQGPTTLPGKGPNPAPDQPEPDLPADEEPLQEDEPEEEEPARPGRT